MPVATLSKVQLFAKIEEFTEIPHSNTLPVRPILLALATTMLEVTFWIMDKLKSNLEGILFLIPSVYARPGYCGEDTCDSMKGSVSCSNGVLSGDTEYKWDSCEGSACPCENAPGGILHSGDSRQTARVVGGKYVPNRVYCYDNILYRQTHPN